MARLIMMMAEEIAPERRSLEEVHGSVAVPSANGKKPGFRQFLAFLGPAYLVSVGYMDPGNWATDLAGGAEFGYALIWVLLMSNLMAILLQTLAARLGVVTGHDLAQALSRRIFAEDQRDPVGPGRSRHRGDRPGRDPGDDHRAEAAVRPADDAGAAWSRRSTHSCSSTCNAGGCGRWRP